MRNKPINIEEHRDLKNLEGIVFTFMSERGMQNLSYAEYLADLDLRAMVNDINRYKLILGRTIFTYSMKYLSQKPSVAQNLRDFEEAQRQNPLRFFAPSGLAMTDFLNDYDNTLCILTAGNRNGKALDDDTMIPTPNGDKRMGDLVEGDFVYGGDGYLATVTGVYPQGEKECFNVTFDNGEVSLVASGDHLWKYLRHKNAFKSKSKTHFNEYEILTTNEIILEQGNDSTPQTRGYIPLAGVPDTDDVDETLTIPPYSLGALLGDGSLSGRDVRISSNDKSIITRLEVELGATAKHYSGYDYGLIGCDIAKKIRDIGLQGKRSWEKSIPNQYLNAPPKDRIELLRGLMDTDGSLAGRAGEYCTVSKELCNDVERLVRSLGGSAKTCVCQKYYTYKEKKLKGRVAYRVRILLWDINPFYLKRKADLWKVSIRRRGRLVYSIKPVGMRKCTCISVNSKDHTFLAGDYIVTHNTQTMLIKKLINCIPCDPSWEIFTKYGVKHRPFRGAKNIGLASYELDFHTDTLLPMILDWAPKRELGKYAKDFKGKGARKVTMRVDPTLELECGSKFMFSAMSQSQGKFEGNVKHDWGWDEQGSEAAFDGADERTRTYADGRHDFAMTPHKVEGRPDTGAGSWINKLYSGDVTKGHSIGIHRCQIWDVPDWIYPEKSKVQAFEKWIAEPTRTLNDKARREGESRFFGKWHEASGLVIDEWDSTKHVIEPFEIPSHWTRVRGVDHGDKHPAACLCCAVSPAGDLFVYRDWLRTGLLASQVAKEVIESCGNTRKRTGTYRNPKTDMMYDKYQEIFSEEHFAWTVFDARAFSHTTKDSGLTLAKLYNMAGLKVKQGSGKDSDHYVPILKEWFGLDFDKKHFSSGEMGAPRVYVFNTCTDFIKTIKRWVWVERKTKSTERLAKESPTKNEDDLMDCLKLIIQNGPKYIGNPKRIDDDFYDGLDEYQGSSRKRYKPADKLTGY